MDNARSLKLAREITDSVVNWLNEVNRRGPPDDAVTDEPPVESNLIVQILETSHRVLRSSDLDRDDSNERVVSVLSLHLFLVMLRENWLPCSPEQTLKGLRKCTTKVLVSLPDE